MEYAVTETFTSIQGESSMQGLLCYFIRMAGCNLSCSYCDTLYAAKGSEFKIMTLDNLLNEAVLSGAGLAEITGGEPLMQDCISLSNALLKKGIKVLIETNGSMDVSGLPIEVKKIIDIKTPGSGNPDFLFENLLHISPEDEIKFVITGRDDYEWALKKVSEWKLTQKTSEIIFSPAYKKMEPEKLALWIKEDRIRVRLQIQLHKYIWPGRDRGV
ncbi:MAG: 7-carboxy-7-deazaguanine synthase QueE [Fibrobacterota bacterium]